MGELGEGAIFFRASDAGRDTSIEQNVQVSMVTLTVVITRHCLTLITYRWRYLPAYLFTTADSREEGVGAEVHCMSEVL